MDTAHFPMKQFFAAVKAAGRKYPLSAARPLCLWCIRRRPRMDLPMSPLCFFQTANPGIRNVSYHGTVAIGCQDPDLIEGFV